MNDQDKINYVKSLISPEQSRWREKAEFRKSNRSWLKHSAKIALRILGELQRKAISQADLARIMNVTPQQITKLVKGQENLTLDTISKIEKALEINLIEVVNPEKIKEDGTCSLVKNAQPSKTMDIIK